jgi:hypothetical protein
MVDIFDKELKFDITKHTIQFLSEVKEGSLRVPNNVLKRAEELGLDLNSVVVTIEVYDGR